MSENFPGAAGKGITITISAETADAIAKVQQFVNGVNAGIKKVKDAADETKKAGNKQQSVWAKLNEATGATEFAQGIVKASLALITLEKIWEGVKEAAHLYVEELREAINRSDEVGRAAEKAGVSLSTINALKIIGTQNRLYFGELDQGLFLFNQHIFEAARRGGEAAKVFREMGISIFDETGALKSNDVILRSVMDRIKELPALQRSGFTRDLFGRAGREWVETLSQGSAKLEEVITKGKGVSEEGAASAREFNITLKEIHESIEQIWNDVAVAVLPFLKQLSASIQTLSDDESTHKEIVEALIAVFKLLAVAALLVEQHLFTIWQLLANTNFLSLGIMADGVQLLIDLFDTMKHRIVDLIAALLDLATAQYRVAFIAGEIASGNMKDAWTDTKKLVGDWEV